MKSKHIVLLAALMLLTLSLSAQGFLSKTAVGLHAGTQSGTGYSMRFMGEKHGFQATIGAVTWGDDNVYFPDKYYRYDYYYDEINLDGYPMASGDTLITVRQDGRLNIANIGLNYIYTLDKFSVLRQKDLGRIYVMAGGSYEYNRQTSFTKDYHFVPEVDTMYLLPVNDDDPVRSSNLQHRWTAGAGLGVELGFGKNFRVALEMPITYNWEKRIVMYLPQIGLYYYFK